MVVDNNVTAFGRVVGMQESRGSVAAGLPLAYQHLRSQGMIEQSKLKKSEEILERIRSSFQRALERSNGNIDVREFFRRLARTPEFRTSPRLMRRMVEQVTALYVAYHF